MEGIRESVQQRVDCLIQRMKAAGECDFVAEFAYPLPSLVIFDLLGVPKEYYDTLRASASAFARFPPAIYSRDYSLLASIANNLEATEQLLLGLLAERRRTPQNDLISSLASTVEGNASLTDGEIVVLCNFLLFAGHETTANLIGGSVLHLLQNREQWEYLRENAELPGGVVEELLRYVSPVLTISRVLKETWSGTESR